MSLTQDLYGSYERFRVYVDRLIDLLKSHEIGSVKALVAAVRRNEAFRRDWLVIWNDIARADGGKLSLTTAGAILGAVLGGVGIAAMGGAIGLPLALVLGLGGLLAGSELDSLRNFWKQKPLLLKLPKPLKDRMKAVAEVEGVTVSELAVQVLATAFPAPEETGMEE